MDETRTANNERSQANVQRKLELVSQNLSDFVDVARAPLKLCHEIYHAHARELERAGHACLRIFICSVDTYPHPIWIEPIMVRSGFDLDKLSAV